MSHNDYPGIVRKGSALFTAGLSALALAACTNGESHRNSAKKKTPTPTATKTWDLTAICPPKSKLMATVGSQQTPAEDIDGWADVKIACVDDGGTILHPTTVYETGEATNKTGFNVGQVAITASLESGVTPDPLQFDSASLTDPTGRQASVSRVSINGVGALQSVAVK